MTLLIEGVMVEYFSYSGIILRDAPVPSESLFEVLSKRTMWNERLYVVIWVNYQFDQNRFVTNYHCGN